MFKRALSRLGPIKSSEAYAFTPLPSLAGTSELENLRKVDAAAYMAQPAKFTRISLMPDYVAEAKMLELL